jgi:hypothetical protein
MNKKSVFWMMAIIFIVVGMVILSLPDSEVNPISTALAYDVQETLVQDDPIDDGESLSNEYCLLCHSQSGREWVLPSGEVLSLTVDDNMLDASVHGRYNPEGALLCSDCHVDHRFPHEPQASQTIREFQLERYASCRNCHEDQYSHAQDSVHGEALRAGRIDAATCVDCHGGHNILPPDQPRQRVSITCGNCHGAVFEMYRGSVHGEALLDGGNPDVPTCVDCHGVHDIERTETEFRVGSPDVCAQCHDDDELMEKYDISTHVFDSYLSDFHGSTVALFRDYESGEPTNKAVCFDCHGAHNILAVNDENSQVMKDNLLLTCRQCHPDADADFPDSWVGHYPPTLESQPLMFLVNLFYAVLIPGTIGGFLFLIATDIFRRVRQRFGISH